MIADKLTNIEKYKSTIPFFNEIVEYINTTQLSSLVPGKHPIVGESVFVLIQEYVTQKETEKKWESHRKFIDIQIVLSGEEYIGFSPIQSLTLDSEFITEKDYVFYRNDEVQRSMVLLTKDEFAIFFPNDAHKPGLHLTHEKEVKKAVIKVLV
jgi:YhcH/YjgK/YiaL family protein